MQRFLSLFSLLILLSLSFALGACGESTATSQPSGSGKTAAAAPTNPPVSTTDMQSYQSTLYTLNYPKDWIKTAVGDNVIFTGVQKGSFTIEVISNPMDVTSASAGINIGLNGLKTAFPDNFQQEQIPDTTTINGVKWNQGEISGSTTKNGLTTSIKSMVLGTNHPENDAKTKLFLVIYTSDANQFDQLLSSTFEPMLASLKLMN